MKLFVPLLAVLLIAGTPVADPDDLENAFQNLKEAEAKKDAAKLKKLAAEACALARKVSAAPEPENEEEKEGWPARVAHARTVELYAEYALYATAIQAPPAVTVELLAALEQQNPKSKYLDDAYGSYFVALQQTGAGSKIAAVAEQAIAHFPDNEDLLLVLADSALNRRQSDRALRYAERLLAVLSTHPKPENLGSAEWQRKRTAAIGRAHWMAGLVHTEKAQYVEADKDLRAALPIIKDSPAMLAAALFNLGVANYQLGRTLLNRARVLEAAKFSEQAAAIPGPLQQQAWRNALVMKTEAAKIR